MRIAPSDGRDRRAVLAFTAALVASLLVLAASGTIERRLTMIGQDDFSRIWAGPRALVTGHDPYDAATWRRTAVDLGTFPPDTDVYLYPPWVAVALAPLAVVPLPVASLAWTTGGFAAAALGLLALCRAHLRGRSVAHAAVATALVLSGPAVSTFLAGQWTFILIAALCAIVLSLRSGRPVAAGLAALATIAKPQLFLFAAPALALHALWPSPERDRRSGIRFVAVAAAGAISLVAVSAALVPSWWPAWPTHVGGAQLGPEHVTVPGILVRTLGDAGRVLALPVLLGIVAVGLRFRPDGPAWLPVWLATSVVAAPYANAYDLLVLIVPVVLAAGAVTDARRASAVLMAGIGILLVGASLLHDLGLLAYAPLVPAATLALIVVALWDRRRDPARRGA